MLGAALWRQRQTAAASYLKWSVESLVQFFNQSFGSFNAKYVSEEPIVFVQEGVAELSESLSTEPLTATSLIQPGYKSQ